MLNFKGKVKPKVIRPNFIDSCHQNCRRFADLFFYLYNKKLSFSVSSGKLYSSTAKKNKSRLMEPHKITNYGNVVTQKV